MNPDIVLQVIEEARSRLEQAGITAEVLLVVGLVAGLLFLISLREVLAWYLKISRLQREVRALRAQLAGMQASIDELSKMMREREDAPAPLKAEAPNERRFPLDH